jgi:predicted transcriptional regulator
MGKLENWKTEKIAYELRKLRVRGAVEKIKSSHYYRLTKEGYIWTFYSFKKKSWPFLL